MTAIISFTDDKKYLFFAPLVNWTWAKLGIDCFFIIPERIIDTEGFRLISKYTQGCFYHTFVCPEYKEPTYSQVSRIYAAAEFSDIEYLITSDADMLVFKNLFKEDNGLWNLGCDLVPDGQLPICYTWGSGYIWKAKMNIGEKTIQECLDEQLGHEECENMRGNLWSRDQELLYNGAASLKWDSVVRLKRARPGTQFAANRVDRDDINWRSYCGPDLIDAHLWRPGYTDENFANILELLTTQYPNDDFQWLIDYRNEYVKLIQNA